MILAIILATATLAALASGWLLFHDDIRDRRAVRRMKNLAECSPNWCADYMLKYFEIRTLADMESHRAEVQCRLSVIMVRPVTGSIHWRRIDTILGIMKSKVAEQELTAAK